jgi:parallel beta-helix repeat protein
MSGRLWACDWLCLVLLASAAPRSSLAVTRWVDGTLASATCSTYDPGTRACGSGTAEAFRTLAAATSAAVQGDEVVLRAGSYADPLAPTTSGAAGSPIVFRAQTGETVNLTSSASPAAIQLDGVSYIELEGLRLDGVRWLEATDCHHITVRGCTFLNTPASGTTGNIRFISSDYNRIVDNTVSNGNDNLLLIDSEHNLVAGNTVSEGAHSILSIRCSDFNIIRDNTFANTIQKTVEIYDCGADTSAVPNAFDSTTHNLFEGNRFTEASAYYSTSGGNGIQYAGQDGIVRRNVFYATNVGLAMQVYDDEALYNRRNRVYHNVFYDNDCAGISISDGGVDNVFKNNILYQNRGWGTDGTDDCTGDGPGQLVYGTPLSGILFTRNDLFDTQAGEAVFHEAFGDGDTLAAFEAQYGTQFFGNLEVEPGFTAAAAHEFTLATGSLMIDAGIFLTETVAAGSGTTMQVADARFFTDGFDIDGEPGDEIQLDGTTATAVVLAVDYASNILTLDHALNWTAAQGVSLRFRGLAPDLGAFEAGPPECQDTLDNDGDGDTDFPADSGCTAADDADESDCGDGVCEGGETCSSCTADCGACPACADGDGDGWGDPAAAACPHPERDCDDASAAVHPGATELCADSVDNDCDGAIDRADVDACPADTPRGALRSGCSCGGGGNLGVAIASAVLVVVSRRRRRGRAPLCG